MKIKSIKLKGFRRFKNLTIKDIPEEARLVVMIGPNGSGKSSVFDALLRFRYRSGRIILPDPDSYFIKFGLYEEDFEEIEIEEPEIQELGFEEPEVEFHTDTPNDTDAFRRSVHMRSAYRNDSANSSNFLHQTQPLIELLRFQRLAENDQAVASNYDRILGPWVERMSARKKNGETADDIEDDLYGELREAIRELFKDPQLTLTGLGNPKNQKIFEFDKGTSQGFSYENLSSGEKAALDLVLDMIIAKSEFKDTVFCIDEPEAHMHTKLQGPLLEQLYKLIPDNSQLWIATHSIGMVRKAQDLWHENPDSVVFLDFGNEKLDFDKKAEITPDSPNSDFWERVYEVAFGDLAELVITERTVFCESRGFDSECYHNIFNSRYPDLTFEPIEGKGNVIKTVKAANRALGKIAKNAMVMGIIDGDTATPGDRKRNAKDGIRILSRKTIESYLLDDEVLKKLCEDHGKSDKISDLLTAKQKALDKHGLKPTDKLKPIVQDIHGTAQNILESVNLGIDQRSFMMDILAQCIQPSMDVYKELHEDIFGE